MSLSKRMRRRRIQRAAEWIAWTLIILLGSAMVYLVAALIVWLGF